MSSSGLGRFDARSLAGALSPGFELPSYGAGDAWPEPQEEDELSCVENRATCRTPDEAGRRGGRTLMEAGAAVAEAEAGVAAAMEAAATEVAAMEAAAMAAAAMAGAARAEAATEEAATATRVRTR